MNDIAGDKLKLYAVLRKEIEETFGRSITTSGDCNLLCAEIYNKTGSTLNQNTLRRFFGLVKASYPASSSTLNILARYCGYHSPDEIQLSESKPAENTLQEEDLSILYYFITLFKAVQIKDADDRTFHTFVGHTINFLQKKPDLIDKFQRAIVKTVNGRQFYFEYFVNFDKLNSFFATGIRFYINENKTPEGQLFGYSLLCIRDWLIGDHIALKKNFEYLRQQSLSPLVPPLIYGRYFAAQLFYADVFEPSSEATLVGAYNVHIGIKASKSKCYLYNCFEYPLSYALILTCHYEEALFYINYAIANYEEKDGHASQCGQQKLLLLKAVALSKINEKKEAENIFSKIHPSQFYFLSKKTDTILYLLLAFYLKKITHKQFRQFKALIKETGFEKFSNFAETEKTEDTLS